MHPVVCDQDLNLPTISPTPFSRSRKKKAKEFGYNLIGLLGIVAVALTFVVLFMIDPVSDFVMWVDLFTVFITMLLLTGIFINYMKK